jgi:hypothetical protein
LDSPLEKLLYKKYNKGKRKYKYSSKVKHCQNENKGKNTTNTKTKTNTKAKTQEKTAKKNSIDPPSNTIGSSITAPEKQKAKNQHFITSATNRKQGHRTKSKTQKY